MLIIDKDTSTMKINIKENYSITTVEKSTINKNKR